MGPDGAFREAGFEERTEAAGVDVGLVAADAHIGYYRDRSPVPRLRQDVVAPLEKRVTLSRDARTVRWNGAVPAGGTVTIVIEAAIALDAEGTLLVNQALVAYDGDGSGDNETLAPSDDPSIDGATDPTAFVVGQAFLAEVPTLLATALTLLALLLAAAGLVQFWRV